MAVSQRQRSQHNPLNLGTFTRTSLRLLIGDLGARNQIISGGYGEYTYNHWFQITIDKPAWLIVIKSGSKLGTENINPINNRYDQTSVRFTTSIYSQNQTPIQGRLINDRSTGYWDQVAGAQSDLYNTFNASFASKNNEMFYPLAPGNYLLCVSAIRNEYLTYGVGLVIEFPSDDTQFILNEDPSTSFMLQEASTATDIGTLYQQIPQLITSDVTLDTINGFTENITQIQNGVAVQVNNQNPELQALTWYIGPLFPNINDQDNRILLDATENWVLTTFDHDLGLWQEAWARENIGAFPAFFIPYAVE